MSRQPPRGNFAVSAAQAYQRDSSSLLAVGGGGLLDNPVSLEDRRQGDGYKWRRRAKVIPPNPPTRKQASKNNKRQNRVLWRYGGDTGQIAAHFIRFCDLNESVERLQVAHWRNTSLVSSCYCVCSHISDVEFQTL